MLIMLSFLIIALMRVVQAVCNKKASTLVIGKRSFFAYGAFYQFIAAVFSFLYLWKAGFYGWNTITVCLALCTALFLTINLFADLEAIKGAPLAVCTMFAMGGLFIPCIVGIFLFNEAMSVIQWLALAVFIVSIYLLSSESTTAKKRLTRKTVLMLVLSCFANGLVMLTQKYFAFRVADGNVALYSCLTFTMSAWILFCCFFLQSCFFKSDQRVERERHHVKFPKILLVYGTALAFALFMINLLVTMLAGTLPSVVLYTVSSCMAIMITTLVGFLVFREKLTAKNLAGLLLGVLSIVLSNIY